MIRIKKLEQYCTLKKIISSAFLVTCFFLAACSSKPRDNKIPALFDSKAEAEKAAESFNCSGAHKMGDKWMPCATHKIHSNNNEASGHMNHHHHH